MTKKDFNISLPTKILQKLSLYIYFSQKWVHIEKSLMKLNMSFMIKDDKLLEKYNERWEKVKNIVKKEFDSKPAYIWKISKS